MNDVQLLIHCLSKLRDMELTEYASFAMITALHEHVETHQDVLGDYPKNTIVDIVDAAHKKFTEAAAHRAIHRKRVKREREARQQ